MVECRRLAPTGHAAAVASRLLLGDERTSRLAPGLPSLSRRHFDSNTGEIRALPFRDDSCKWNASRGITALLEDDLPIPVSSVSPKAHGLRSRLAGGRSR